MSDVMLSVCCITYNHEKFIKHALDSFLMQQTNFEFEILINDDCSRDNTPNILRDYEKRYPGRFNIIYQTENQFSKGVKPFSQILAPKAKGKYIALCEGDDYWIQPDKLQKQVDFLEANSDYNLTVGGIRFFNEITKEEFDEIRIPSGVVSNKEGFTFSLSDTKKLWLTRTLTVVFRNDRGIIENYPNYKHGRDVHLIYHILKNSKGFYFTEIFGVYRVHPGGIESMQHGKVNRNNSYNCFKDLYYQQKDEYSRYNFLRNILSLLNFNLNNKNEGGNWKKNFKLFIEAVSITSNLTEFKLLIWHCIPDEVQNFYHKIKHSKIRKTINVFV